MVGLLLPKQVPVLSSFLSSMLSPIVENFPPRDLYRKCHSLFALPCFLPGSLA